jgi:hypothetical protein
MEIDAKKDIEVNIVYHENEIKKAISFYLLKIKNMRIYAIVAYAILGLATIASLFYCFYDSAYLGLPIMFLFIWFIIHYIYYIRPLQAYKEYYMKQKGAMYRFRHDNVFRTNDEAQSTIQWTVYIKAYETTSAFLLIDRNEFICVFPKNCFDSVSDLEDIRRLLITKMNMQADDC